MIGDAPKPTPAPDLPAVDRRMRLLSEARKLPLDPADHRAALSAITSYLGNAGEPLPPLAELARMAAGLAREMRDARADHIADGLIALQAAADDEDHK